jgi:hypothetical protein
MEVPAADLIGLNDGGDRRSRAEGTASAPGDRGQSAKVRVEMPLLGNKHVVGYTTSLGFDDAPMLFEGLLRRLRDLGVEIDPILTSAPWFVDGRPISPAHSRSLFSRPPDQDLLEEGRVVREQLAAVAADHSNAVRQGPPILYEGADLRPVIAEALAAQIPSLATLHDFHAQFRSLFRESRPDLLLGPRIDSGFCYALSAAKQEGIRAASLEISFQFHEANRMHLRSRRPEAADVLCYWGAASVERLKKLELASSAQVVTGLHLLDYYHNARADRARVLQRQQQHWRTLGFPGVEGPVVLFASHYGGVNPMVNIDFLVEAIGTILGVMEKHGRGTVILKTLPTDDPDALHQLGRDFDSARLRILTPDQPFQNIAYILGADLVLCIPSTFLAEATAAGVPACTLLFGDVIGWYAVSLEQVGHMTRIAPGLDSEAKLAAVIEDLLAGTLRLSPPDPAAAAALFGSLDGGNLDRIMAAVNERLNLSLGS